MLLRKPMNSTLPSPVAATTSTPFSPAQCSPSLHAASGTSPSAEENVPRWGKVIWSGMIDLSSFGITETRPVPRSRYGPGGESRLIRTFCEHWGRPYDAARTYSTNGLQSLTRNSQVAGAETAVHCPPFTVHCPPFTVHCPPFTVHCPPFTVHCPLFTVHCSLPTVHPRRIQPGHRPHLFDVRGNVLHGRVPQHLMAGL